MVIYLIKKIYSLMITIILFLVTIILLKSNFNFKNWFDKNVLNNHISITNIASKYETLFGKPLPFRNLIKEPVFSEKLNYLSKEKYKEGVLLKLSNNLVPSLDKGLVIFVGKKDEENCITIESIDYDTTYCMLMNIGVKLYDHVDIGTYIGEVNEKLILYFTKNGEYLDYEEYI